MPPPPTFRCPNPICTHSFARSAVKGAAALTCPACGQTFRFRAPAAPAEAPAEPPLVVSPTRRRRPRSPGAFLKGSVVFLALALVVGGVLFAYRGELAAVFAPPETDDTRPAQIRANFSFQATGWRPDEALREKTRANLAVTLKKPRSHLAFYYRDHSPRGMSDGEMLDRVLRHLRAYFPQFDYEDPFQGGKDGRTGDVGGEPAVAFTFSAAGLDDVPMRGQVLMLSRQGFAYWLVLWTPEDFLEEAAAAWEQVKQGFKFYNDREGWKPTPRPVETVTNAPLAYQLDYAREFWRKDGSPKETDAAAVLLLRAFEPIEDEETGKPRVVEHAGRAAEVQVLHLPKAASLDAAVKAAVEHVRKKRAETSPMLKVEPMLDRKTGKPLTGGKFGKLDGQVDRLRVELSPDNERYAVLAVAQRPEGTLAVVCECRWDRREYWDPEFRELLGSARTPAAAAEGEEP